MKYGLLGGLEPENSPYFTATDEGDRGGPPRCGEPAAGRACLAQGAEAAGFFVEGCEAYGVQVLQDADGSFT